MIALRASRLALSGMPRARNPAPGTSLIHGGKWVERHTEAREPIPRLFYSIVFLLYYIRFDSIILYYNTFDLQCDTAGGGRERALRGSGRVPSALRRPEACSLVLAKHMWPFVVSKARGGAGGSGDPT